LHGNVAQYRRCLADFFANGLQDGLRVAYVSSDGAQAARADLTDLGDLDRLLAAGALHVLSVRDIYGAGGPVDPERVVASFAAMTEQAPGDGFRGLAMSALATELVRTPVQRDAFARCEFLVDRYMASHPLSALCGYGLELGNDTVTEFAMLHAPGPSNERRSQCSAAPTGRSASPAITQYGVERTCRSSDVRLCLPCMGGLWPHGVTAAPCRCG
jgi:hypothetical protein